MADAAQFVVDHRDAQFLVGEAELPECEEFGDRIILAVARIGHEFIRRRPIVRGPVGGAVGLVGLAVEEAVDGLKLPIAVESGSRLTGLQPGVHPGLGTARAVRRAGRERLGELGQPVQDTVPLGYQIQAAPLQGSRAENSLDRRRRRRACGLPFGPCGTLGEEGETRDRNREK